MILQPLHNDKQAYDTHYNYISCLNDLIKDTTIHTSISLKQSALPLLGTKDNLIRLTKKSLTDEREIVRIDTDYSYASTSWLPIKSYYLIFNILLTVEYAYKLQKASFHLSHATCIEEFTRKLEAGEIQFSEPILNQVFDQSILNHTVRAGANLSSKTGQEEMYKMAIRKIAKYKFDDWKQKQHINLKKSDHKTNCSKYLSTFRVSIFDFPYNMRIRSNYRDFAFIDAVGTTDTANYFNMYFSFTARFVKALEGLKQEIVTARS